MLASIELSDSALKVVFIGTQAAGMFVTAVVALRGGAQRRVGQEDRRSLLGTRLEIAGAALPLVALAACLSLLGKAGIESYVLLALAGTTVDIFAAIFIASPRLRSIALYGLVLGILGINAAWAWTIPGPASVVITALMFWIGFRIMWREVRKRRPRTG